MQALIAAKANLAVNAFWLTALRLQALFGKAGFNPNQARVPRGRTEGGRWTRDGGTPSAPNNLEFDKEGNPRLPATRPDSVKFRNRLSKQLAKWAFRRLVPALRVIEIMEASGWLLDDAFSVLSNLDPPQTLETLRERTIIARAFGRTAPGYEFHHIVEQEAARQAGFPETAIEDLENVVAIPKYRHHDITSWYTTRNKDYGELSPREYLRGKSWEERRSVGLRALEIQGVLKP